MKLKIQVATTEDVPEIRALALKIWPVTFDDILSPEQMTYMLDMMYNHASLKEQMEEKGHVFLLAMAKNKTVGYASYELNYKDSPTVKIHKIYLLPKTQGHGFGKAIINKISEAGITEGQTQLTLNVNRFNRALGFYEKLGFKQTATEDIAIGNGFLMEDAVLEMVL